MNKPKETGLYVTRQKRPYGYYYELLYYSVEKDKWTILEDVFGTLESYEEFDEWAELPAEWSAK